MNKPDWKDAPEWAEWLAMDKDHEWYWFENRPQLTFGYWVQESNDKTKLAQNVSIKWKETLQKRPK